MWSSVSISACSSRCVAARMAGQADAFRGRAQSGHDGLAGGVADDVEAGLQPAWVAATT